MKSAIRPSISILLVCPNDPHAGDGAPHAAPARIGRRRTNPAPVPALGDRQIPEQCDPVALSGRWRPGILPRPGTSGDGARRTMALDSAAKEQSVRTHWSDLTA